MECPSGAFDKVKRDIEQLAKVIWCGDLDLHKISKDGKAFHDITHHTIQHLTGKLNTGGTEMESYYISMMHFIALLNYRQ